jgi:putative transposase
MVTNAILFPLREVQQKSSAVYNTNHHIVWCPKFRKPILVGRVKEFVEEQTARDNIVQTKGYKILEAKVMPDHIHVFVEADSFDSPTNIVKIFKGVTGLRPSRWESYSNAINSF